MTTNSHFEIEVINTICPCSSGDTVTVTEFYAEMHYFIYIFRSQQYFQRSGLSLVDHPIHILGCF